MCLQYMELVKTAASLKWHKLSLCALIVIHVENLMEVVSTVNTKFAILAANDDVYWSEQMMILFPVSSSVARQHHLLWAVIFSTLGPLTSLYVSHGRLCFRNMLFFFLHLTSFSLKRSLFISVKLKHHFDDMSQTDVLLTFSYSFCSCNSA